MTQDAQPPKPRTSYGDYQERNEFGYFIPKPVYQLVPCAKCLVLHIGGFGSRPCDDCGGRLYVRLNPEDYLIAPKVGAQEKPTS